MQDSCTLGSLVSMHVFCVWAPIGRRLPPSRLGKRPLLPLVGPGQPSRTPHLEQVVPRGHISDVHPLAVDVMTVHVPAAHGDALLAEVGTLVILLDVCRQGQKQARSLCTQPLACTLPPPSVPRSPHRAPTAMLGGDVLYEQC